MHNHILFLLIALSAAIAPMIEQHYARAQQQSQSPGKHLSWPQQFEGKSLTALPLSALETRFLTRFPGDIARFSDGNRVIVMRRISRPTRMLHPASDCFRGIGYKISDIKITQREQQGKWRSFTATANNRPIQVFEKITDNAGNEFTDTSSWYWHALLGQSKGPWLAITIAQQTQSQ